MVDLTVEDDFQCVVLKVCYLYSSIAQSVEHAAVNRAVVGSSPTRGVCIKKMQKEIDSCLKIWYATAVAKM